MAARRQSISASVFLVAVACAPDRSISSWSSSLAADATDVYWIDPHLGLRAFRFSSGTTESLAPAAAADEGTTSFNNLKLSGGTLFWSGSAAGASPPPVAAVYATPAIGGPSSVVLRLEPAESIIAFDVLGDVLYVYVERDDAAQIVWSLREMSLSTGTSVDVPLGSAAPLPTSTGVGRRGQQVIATGSAIFYLLWEPEASIAGAKLTVLRLWPDGRSERLADTVPPFQVDARLAVTSDMAYWLAPDAKNIQAVPLAGGTVRTVLSLEPSSRATPFGTDKLCTIAASPAALFAFHCIDTGDPLGWDFLLLTIDPRGTTTQTLRRRAFAVRALIAAGDREYWFEDPFTSAPARLRSSQ